MSFLDLSLITVRSKSRCFLLLSQLQYERSSNAWQSNRSDSPPSYGVLRPAWLAYPHIDAHLSPCSSMHLTHDEAYLMRVFLHPALIMRAASRMKSGMKCVMSWWALCSLTHHSDCPAAFACDLLWHSRTLAFSRPGGITQQGWAGGSETELSTAESEHFLFSIPPDHRDRMDGPLSAWLPSSSSMLPVSVVDIDGRWESRIYTVEWRL